MAIPIHLSKYISKPGLYMDVCGRFINNSQISLQWIWRDKSDVILF